jgi:type VI secretion system secreted protein VgrG
VPGAPYKATLSNGSVYTGALDADGFARIANVPAGTTATVEYLRDERTPECEVAAKVDDDWSEFLSIDVAPQPVNPDAKKGDA